MNQLSQPPHQEPSNEFRLPWELFVTHVLDVTVTAYQAMREAGVANREWEENVFTIQLADRHILPLLQQLDSPIRVWPRAKVHTEQMYTGDQATNEAKEEDMLLYDIGEWEYQKIHFVWEAKRVGDKRANERYSSLNSEYVHEAIYRFIKREYAAAVGDAGVLAYVLAGSVSNIVTDINVCMENIRKNPPLPASNHLQRGAPINDFEDVYHSEHDRMDGSSLQLHHLFLTFDFE